LRRFVYRKSGTNFTQGKAETMTSTKSERMKALAVGAATAIVLGGGATAVLMPSIASAAGARQGAADAVGHVRHSGADDAVGQR
jgi:hypothetical protein